MSANFDGVGDADITEKNVTIIDPTVEGGTTALLLGGSMTAKSSLIVRSIKNLIRMFPDRFDSIVVMTGSVNAEPLKGLPEEVILLPVYVPEMFNILKRINQATNNRYGFLVILDDCLSTRGRQATEAINILRNSGISTVISVQSPTFINPSMRTSFHNVYITGSRTSEARKKMGEMFLDPYLHDKGIRSRDAKENWIRKNTELRDEDRTLIRINGVQDKMYVHKIRKI